MKFEWILELVKAVVPAVIAWYLATQSNKKTAEKNRKEMREQLRISKDNNQKVQLKAYKMQFCLEELKKQDILIERSMNDLFTMFGNVERFLRDQNLDSLIVLNNTVAYLSQANKSMIDRFGFLQAMINQVRPASKHQLDELTEAVVNDKNNYNQLINLIQSCLFHFEKEHDKNYLSRCAESIQNELKKLNYEKSSDGLLNLRNFILTHHEILFKQMD